MLNWIIRNIIKPRWVSFEFEDSTNSNELGIQIFGVVIGLYNGGVIYYNNPKNIRKPKKKEFGESIYPVSQYNGTMLPIDRFNKQIELWEAIHKYVQSCGGDLEKGTTSIKRMDAVVEIENIVFGKNY